VLRDCHPLIISGAPRSGTSLLYNLFDGHSDVAWLVDEGYLFEYLHDFIPGAAALFVDAIPDDLSEMVAGLRDKQVMPPVHRAYSQSKRRGTVSEVAISAPWDEDAFRRALAECMEPTVSALWRRMVGALLAGMGEPVCRHACMKAPDYGKSAESALALIDEARAIVIVRDPLHALDSLKRSRELRNEQLLTWPLLARHVRHFQQLGERLQRLDPSRLLTVRYETLVAEPEATMRAVAEWLAIPFEPCLLVPTMRGRHWPGISSFRSTEGIDQRAAERPIEALTAHEQELIRKHLGGFRAAHGYA
jgi:hypothetical protein